MTIMIQGYYRTQSGRRKVDRRLPLIPHATYKYALINSERRLNTATSLNPALLR